MNNENEITFTGLKSLYDLVVDEYERWDGSAQPLVFAREMEFVAFYHSLYEYLQFIESSLVLKSFVGNSKDASFQMDWEYFQNVAGYAKLNKGPSWQYNTRDIEMMWKQKGHAMHLLKSVHRFLLANLGKGEKVYEKLNEKHFYRKLHLIFNGIELFEYGCVDKIPLRDGKAPKKILTYFYDNFYYRNKGEESVILSELVLPSDYKENYKAWVNWLSSKFRVQKSVVKKIIKYRAGVITLVLGGDNKITFE